MTDWSMFRSTHVNSTQNSQVWEWAFTSRVFKIEHFNRKFTKILFVIYHFWVKSPQN